jgi:FAD synthetase
MKKILVAGTFDIIHPGHLYLLKQAKKRGDFLIVVIARDKTVKKEKGHLPINNEKQRIKNLKKLNIANQIIIGNQGDKLKIIDNLRPDVICLGYDQRAKIKNLKKKFNKRKFNPKIIRFKAFQPHRFKSSFLIKHNP